MLELNESTFNETVNKDELVVVDFYATWCGPCRLVVPVLEKVEDKVKVVKVNADQSSALLDKYDISRLPTLAFFKSGNLLEKMVGLTTQSVLEQKINQYK